MRVEDVMTRGVEVVAPDTTVQRAAIAMAERDIGTILIGSEHEPQGMLTDRDIILRVVVEAKDVQTTTVGEVMSRTLFTCQSTDEIEQAWHLMETHQVRRLPVLDDAGRVTGMVARSDILRARGIAMPPGSDRPPSDEPSSEASSPNGLSPVTGPAAT
jgi:CBS domain-containing protein